MHVSLREVRVDDLPVFFEHQRDPVALRMAAFRSREHEAFMAHWKKIMADPACVSWTILADDNVVGHIGAWTAATPPGRLIGYWVGRDWWGRGIATSAVREFLNVELIRPLTAQVAKHNVGSIRVLQKCGFGVVGAESFTTPEEGTIEEWVLQFPDPAAGAVSS